MNDRIFKNLLLTKFDFWKCWKSTKFCFVLQCIQREKVYKWNRRWAWSALKVEYILHVCLSVCAKFKLKSANFFIFLQYIQKEHCHNWNRSLVLLKSIKFSFRNIQLWIKKKQGNVKRLTFIYWLIDCWMNEWMNH